MISTYIFDLDDTIIDTSIYARMYNSVIQEILDNLDISEIELQKKINEIKEDSQRKPDTHELCKKLNVEEIYYKVLKRYIRHTYTLKTKSIPSIFKKIKEKGKKIGIVSKSQEKTIGLFLDRFNLLDYVDFIVSGKKDTVLFWITLEKKQKLQKEDTLVIDDSDEILEVAEHAGYKVLNVKNLDNIDKFDF